MITRVGVLDGVSPAVQAWLKDLNPGSRRALLNAGRLIRDTAKSTARGSFGRSGQNRVLKGNMGITVRESREAGVPAVRIWHGSGILAAYELGSTVPPGRSRRQRPFTLRRRPTLGPAYTQNATAVLKLLEAEYTKLLTQAPPPVRYG